MTSFQVVSAVTPPFNRYGIGKLSGNLYLRVDNRGGASHVVDVVLLAPGPANESDLQVGMATEQNFHQIEWLPAGTKLEIET